MIPSEDSKSLSLAGIVNCCDSAVCCGVSRWLVFGRLLTLLSFDIREFRSRMDLNFDGLVLSSGSRGATLSVVFSVC
jgi:hypothetical protein